MPPVRPTNSDNCDRRWDVSFVVRFIRGPKVSKKHALNFESATLIAQDAKALGARGVSATGVDREGRPTAYSRSSSRSSLASVFGGPILRDAKRQSQGIAVSGERSSKPTIHVPSVNSRTSPTSAVP